MSYKNCMHLVSRQIQVTWYTWTFIFSSFRQIRVLNSKMKAWSILQLGVLIGTSCINCSWFREDQLWPIDDGHIVTMDPVLVLFHADDMLTQCGLLMPHGAMDLTPTISMFKLASNKSAYTCQYYNDVIMGAMASQITGVSIVYSTVCSGADQRKHQSSASLAFVGGIHWWPVNSPHKGPVTRWRHHELDTPLTVPEQSAIAV